MEVKKPDFRIDGVFVPSSNSSAKTVYFVEVQFQKDQLLYCRFFAEMFVYLDQNPATRDWQAVVVYPRRSLEPNESNLYRALLESPQVQRVYLDEIEQILGLSELKQTRVYQEARAEGRLEGIQEGQQREAATLVLRQLARRLGQVAPEVRSQIQQLPVAQLEELGEALLDFSSAQDLADWLQHH